MLALAAFAIFQLTPGAPDTPYREPQLAASANLAALAFGAGQGVYVATSSDQGHTFSKPVQVAKAHVLPLNRHRGPRVVISNGTIIVTAVAGHTEAKGEHSHGLPADGDLLAWRSTDGGKTWSKGVRINDVPAAPREGLHTLAADGRGNVFAAWLDLRTSGGRKEGTRLFGAYSKDHGASWSANVLLYESPEGTICQCCHPSAAYTSAGQLEVMWRNCLGGSRDFYMIRSAGAGKFTEPEKLGKGTWKINACPMDGGGIAHDGKRTVTAWRRDGDVFLAEPGKLEVKIGEGKDIAVAAGKNGIYAAWIKGTQLVIWHEGKADVLAEKAAFPALAALPDGGVLAAWEEEGAISVRLLGDR
jgi:hypothetical protein